LLCFYKKNENAKKLTETLNKDSKISLRAIDFLCTNYSKNLNVIYMIDNQPFNLYVQYRAQLKAYSKLQFDPFRRHERIKFMLNDTEIETTVAQLNFFRWAIQKKVIDWIEKNISFVEKEMYKK